MDDDVVETSPSTEVAPVDSASSPEQVASEGGLDKNVDSDSLQSPPAKVAAVGSGPYRSADTGTYYEVASRVVDNTLLPVDYLFLRDSEYSYTLYTGHIDFSGRVASGSGLSYTRWSRDNSTYGYVENHGTTSIKIDCGSYTCFASAPGWPALDVSTSFQTYLLAFSLLVMLCCYVLAKVFNFCLRRSDSGRPT